MNIDVALSTDASAIAELHARSWRIAYRGMMSDAFLDNEVEQDRRRVWLERFATPKQNQLILATKQDNELLGFVCAFGNEDPQWGTYIDNLHVQPDRKRQGIGRQLMIAVARWSQKNYPQAGLYLGVLEPNLAARRFYEALGARNQESRLWTPPGGGQVVDLRYVWPSAEHLLRCVNG